MGEIQYEVVLIAAAGEKTLEENEAACLHGKKGQNQKGSFRIYLTLKAEEWISSQVEEECFRLPKLWVTSENFHKQIPIDGLQSDSSSKVVGPTEKLDKTTSVTPKLLVYQRRAKASLGSIPPISSTSFGARSGQQLVDTSSDQPNINQVGAQLSASSQPHGPCYMLQDESSSPSSSLSSVQIRTVASLSDRDAAASLISLGSNVLPVKSFTESHASPSEVPSSDSSSCVHEELQNSSNTSLAVSSKPKAEEIPLWAQTGTPSLV
ncbi:hypothetical protein V6N13_133473 [Hibiscus sabdariffa]|uniref:Uncharacterized protein n=1 Tax=Hibiscus sabdariffa TaxID=183260 RepID=A0ABR2CJ07_9ROSI